MIYADITHSKELKDLFPDGEYRWVKYTTVINGINTNIDWYVVNQDEFNILDESEPCNFQYMSALHTDMLLEILPNYIKKKNIPYWLTIRKATMNYTIVYECSWSEWDKKGWPHLDNVCMDKSLPNALSKLVIYLKYNGLLDNKCKEGV